MRVRSSIGINTLWNLCGMGFPIVVALFAIPPLILGLGTERFGILAIGWAVLGYFAFFDLGLGQATTKYISERIERGQSDRVPSLVWSSLAGHFFLGMTGGVLLAVAAPWLSHKVLNLPAALQGEALGCFYWLAASIPLIVTTTCLRGVLEAFHRFDLVNMARIPASTLNYLAPLIVMHFSADLVSIVAVITLGRCIVLAAYLMLCLAAVPGMLKSFGLELNELKPLIAFGGWVTVSSLVTPVMLFADRFFVASMFSVEAVTYYVTPYEIVTKLWIFSAGLLSVLFPVFSALSVGRIREVPDLSRQALRFLVVVVVPMVGAILTFGREFLFLWVGPDFAQQSTAVAKWLAVGVLVNVLAQVPLTVLQSTGRPGTVTRLQLAELPIYLLIAWQLSRTFGSVGVAMAWTLRAALDAALLTFAAREAIWDRGSRHFTDASRKALMVLLFLAIAWLLDSLFRLSPLPKAVVFLPLVAAFIAWQWRFVFTASDRANLTSRIDRIPWPGHDRAR